MRVLHASLTREFGGSERYCASLAAAQAAAGHDVRVIIRATDLLERWKAECGKAVVWALPAWIPSFLERWAIARYMSGFVPEVVHTHLGRADIKAGKAAKALKFPWVTTVHLRWKPNDMAAADAAICIADWQKPELERSGYAGVIATVWNWLPKLAPATPAEVERVRHVLNTESDTVVFVSAGRLHEQKGMDVLIPAFKQAFAGNPNVRLAIVGEGGQRPVLEELIAGDNRIILAGYQAHMAPWYKAAGVYVSASRYEPFGLTILEAMGQECALVCTRTEGPSEFLQGYDVHWAACGDANSLAEALKAAYPCGRERVQHAMAPFETARGVKEIDAVYARLVRR